MCIEENYNLYVQVKGRQVENTSTAYKFIQY
jgi:hypothetical protein